MTEKRRETERHRVNDNSLERDTETERERQRGMGKAEKERWTYRWGEWGRGDQRRAERDRDTQGDQDLYYCFVGFTWLYIHVLAEPNPSKYGNKASGCQSLQ